MNPRHLLFALGVVATLLAATLALRTLRPSPPAVAVRIEGRFTRDGQYPGQPLALTPAPRTWGSWSGADTHDGTLVLGPFPTSATIRLALSGYPHLTGNDLYLEIPGLDFRFPLETEPIGERWEIKTFVLPPGWRGRLVNLVAVDRAHGHGGWLAVSEPLPPAAGPNLEFSFTADLAAWLVTGLLLGTGFLGTARWLRGRVWLPDAWVAIAAAGCVALAAYAAFWVYLLHPLAGRVFSVAALAAGAFAAWRAPPRPSGRSDEWPLVGALAVGIGLLYLGLLHLFPAWRDVYDLAANRFIAALPGDNRVPHDIAILLYEGLSPRNFSLDWQSSDRPPLQTGWLLLTWPWTAWLGFGATTASGAAAMWLQLFWVACAYGLLRTLGLTRPRAAAWTTLLACSGFFLLNTVFTWPKLSAAAFAIGAFALWLRPDVAQASSPASDEQARRLRYGAGAVLAGLAWLSHGGVAFSFLVLAPWLAWCLVATLQERRGSQEWRGFFLAAIVFAVLAAPWLAYQKFYDPPGHRLLKWHLAGVSAKDPRGTWETIHTSYQALTWSQIWEHKAFNLRRQVEGDWQWWRRWTAAEAPHRRKDEFFFTARALTWWVLGLAALPVALARGRLRAHGPPHGALAVWSLATLIVWCLLMFTGGQAVVHHGSYVVMLALFALLSAWCEFASPWMLAVVGGLQAALFATTWAVSNDVVHGPLNGAAATLAALAAAAAVAIVVREHRRAEAP